jgi:hypothetical protein
VSSAEATAVASVVTAVTAADMIAPTSCGCTSCCMARAVAAARCEDAATCTAHAQQHSSSVFLPAVSGAVMH